MRLIYADDFERRIMEENEICEDCAYIVVNLLDDAPTVDAMPVVHGHWDCIDVDGNVWRCSVCGEDWMLSNGTPNENNMHYCTACGAKLVERKGR